MVKSIMPGKTIDNAKKSYNPFCKEGDYIFIDGKKYIVGKELTEIKELMDKTKPNLLEG